MHCFYRVMFVHRDILARVICFQSLLSVIIISMVIRTYML